MTVGEITRVALFIDGGYWSAVRSFQRQHANRPGPNSLERLLEYVQAKVSELEGRNGNPCLICETHYFRGYLGTNTLEAQDRLRQQSRLLDELLQLGIEPHFLPMLNGMKEKGVDVALALEAYAAVAERGVELVFMVASDGDYVPLIRALKRKGGRVVLLVWDFEYDDTLGRHRVSRTSAALAREAWRLVQVDHYRELRADDTDSAEATEAERAQSSQDTEASLDSCVEPIDGEEDEGIDITEDLLSGLDGRGTRTGRIESLHDESFGFIRDHVLPDRTWFFHRNGLNGVAYEDLSVGTEVIFGIGHNHQGPIAERVSLQVG